MTALHQTVRPLPHEVCSILARAIQQHGWSHVERRCGVNKRTIRRVLAGDPCRAANYMRLCRYAGMWLARAPVVLIEGA